MPRIAGKKVPSYCLHKASGQAIVRIAKRDHYLGPYGSPESHERYKRLLNETQVFGAPVAAPTEPGPIMTLAEALLRYRAFAESYYSEGGKPTREFENLKYAFRPVRELYGSLPASEFGPRALKTIQQHWVLTGNHCRREINKMSQRIVRAFKWLASEELVPATVFHALRTVTGLREGKTAAPERAPISPVEDKWVEATLPFAAPPVAAMIQLQRLTGMRPGEVTRVRGCDLDRTGEIWILHFRRHKNAWRGHSRKIPIGPQAQALLKRFLKDNPEDYLFSPQDAELWRNQQRRAQRKTPMTPSQSARVPKQTPQRAKRLRYDRDSYRRAIEYAIKKANRERTGDLIPHWFPLQLRHTKGTEVRKRFGLEAAQVSLGHKHANVTEIYAEKNFELATEVAKVLG